MSDLPMLIGGFQSTLPRGERPPAAPVSWRKHHKRRHNPSTIYDTRVSRWRCVVRAGGVGLAFGAALAWAGLTSAMPVSVKSLPLKYEDGLSLDARFKDGRFARHLNDVDLLNNGCMASPLTSVYKIADTGKHEHVTLEQIPFVDDAVVLIADKMGVDGFTREDYISFAHLGDIVGLVARPTDIDFFCSRVSLYPAETMTATVTSRAGSFPMLLTLIFSGMDSLPFSLSSLVPTTSTSINNQALSSVRIMSS